MKNDDIHKKAICRIVQSVLIDVEIYLSEPATGYRNPYPEITYPLIGLRQAIPTPMTIVENFIFNKSKLIDSERSFLTSSLCNKLASSLSDEQLIYLYEHHQGELIHKVLHDYPLVKKYLSHPDVLNKIDSQNLVSYYAWIKNNPLANHQHVGNRELTHDLFKSLSIGDYFKDRHCELKDFLNEHGYPDLTHIIFSHDKKIYVSLDDSIAYNFQINIFDLPNSSRGYPHESHDIHILFKLILAKIKYNISAYSKKDPLIQKIDNFYASLDNDYQKTQINLTIVSKDKEYSQAFMESFMQIFCLKISQIDKFNEKHFMLSEEDFLQLFGNAAIFYNKCLLEKQMPDKKQKVGHKNKL